MPWIKCFGGGAGKNRRGKSLTVSQPIHLLVKNEYQPQCHVFRTKKLRKPRPCHLCHQPVIKQGSCCRVCKYICHKACEDKGARFRDTSQQIHKQWEADPARAFPIVGNVGDVRAARVQSPENSTPSPSPTDTLENTRNGNYETTSKNGTSTRSRTKQVTRSSVTTTPPPRTPGIVTETEMRRARSTERVSELMELYYVTERIIALWYREDARNILEHATRLFRGKHADNYVIFNLSSPERTTEPDTREAGWPKNLAPSLERLCALCKELDSWLNGAPNRVAVLHVRGGKERLGVAVSAYMNYSSICGGRDQALDRYAMRRFLEDKIGPLRVPSHRRYVEYFSGLLSGSLRISPSPLYLTHLTVLGVPRFEPNGCRAFLKVYEGLTPVYTSDLYSVTNAREFTVNLGGLRLRGDILVKCYHRVYSTQNRQVMFSLQFHTCVITENVVSFPRSELDVACEDSRCPADGVVTLYFASDAGRRIDGTGGGPVPAPTPAIPHASAHHDPILHWDSYTNLEISDDEGRETPLSPEPPSTSSVQTSPRGLGYTCGPIDGSLYAVVHQGGTGVSRNSPLTVSMDSGISSAPPQRPSPPETNEDSENRGRDHGDLDRLLHDMMMTVESMPDPPAESYRQSYDTSYGGTNYNEKNREETIERMSLRKERVERREEIRNLDINVHASNANGNVKGSFSPGGKIDFIDEEIPYHARETSQPFTYGATSDMLKQQILSSPLLVRKASLRGIAPVVHLDDVLGEREETTTSTTTTFATSNTPDPPPEFANVTSSTTNNARSPPDYSDGLSWLRQQQLKLAARRDERSPSKQWRQESGNKMLGELRTIQRGRIRQDGYASDSAVLDDDDDIWLSSSTVQTQSRTAPYTSAPASPLLPQRSSSRKFNGSNTLAGIRSRAESVNERPFVTVKRSYEFRKNSDSQSPPMSPRSALGVLSYHHQQQHRTLTRNYRQHENPNSVAFQHQDTTDHRHHRSRQTSQEQQRQQISPKSPPPPPPPLESRSDSFARTESLVQNLSLHRHHDDPDDRRNDHGDEQYSMIVKNTSKERDSGLLTFFDNNHRRPNEPSVNGPLSPGSTSSSATLTATSNPGDPLVSLIQSLAEISPIRNPPTNKNNDHHHHHHHQQHQQHHQHHQQHHHHQQHQRAASISTTTTTNSSPNQSPKAWHCGNQSHNDSVSSWTERSVSPGGPTSNASRPQTPAFPVHPRTPYVNNASPTVTFASDKIYSTTNSSSSTNSHHATSTNNANNNTTTTNNNNHNNNNNNNIQSDEGRIYNGNYGTYGTYGSERNVYIEERREVSRDTGLPPKSPTTQRRLSFPASGSIKQTHNKRWPLTNQSASFDYSKDRPVSPNGESFHSQSPGITNASPVEYAQSPKSASSYTSLNNGGQSSPKFYYGSRRSSVHSNTEPQEVADANVKFVRDTSRIWYKPNISREQAIAMLRDATPGMFVVRDSNSFPGAFGLALKVATPPPGAPSSPRDPSSELVRHFLIEPTSRGVRLKGCANEPVFSSLSALVYQHSLMAMALPCQLLLPEAEAAARALDSPGTSNAQQLLAQGAACNVLYLFTIDTESLTGPQAIKKAVGTLFDQRPLPTATIVHFKVSAQGITLTDNARKLFFRRHYPTNNVSYCGIDADERTWDFVNEDATKAQSAHRCFGFVARKPAHKSDNQCHVFAELEPEQPATAIVNFVNKVMMGSAQARANIV